MAYTPKTWVCGETITANGLNNIEEGVQEALECCGSGGDCGYSCNVTETTVFNGELTTSDDYGLYDASFTPSETIDSSSVTVRLNGAEYELPKVTIDFDYGYGEWDSNTFMPIFTNYPCAILITTNGNFFCTPSVGTYNVELSINLTEVESVSECFYKASKFCGIKNVVDAESGGVLANKIDINQAGNNAFAEGHGTNASGINSHAEGAGTTASAQEAHAEGRNTVASGAESHAEGFETTASGLESHAEGAGTTASGRYSHSQNRNTIAQGQDQTAIGKFNIAQGSASSSSETDYAFIIGNGTADNARSNAFAIKWDGTFVFANGTEITPAQFVSLLALL